LHDKIFLYLTIITCKKENYGDLPKSNNGRFVRDTEIYNDAIQNTTATFDTQPKTLKEQQAWFVNHQPRHPVLVAEQDGIIVGWASLSKWSDRCAYSDTAEASIYIRKEYRGRGIGGQLLEMLLAEGKSINLHTVIARIADGNKASLALFKSKGFNDIGVMKEVGRKFGKLLDVYLMQKIY
jgi:phosphinothricin acetyltransferase